MHICGLCSCIASEHHQSPQQLWITAIYSTQIMLVANSKQSLQNMPGNDESTEPKVVSECSFASE